nr:MFS transporter [Chromobacterium sp. ASV5]
MTIQTHSRASALNLADYKTLGLAALGGALEIYDFIIFAFFATTLSQLFFPPDMPEWLRLLQTFAIFSTGYLARPLGGILMAHFADKLGRKRIFSLTIFLMAGPCLIIGLMPTYADIGYAAPLLLLALRVIQGAAVGGEVPSAWSFVAEHAPRRHRGYALGMLQAGLTFGYLLGALTATALAKWFSPQEMLDGAWRIPFLLGGPFGLLTVWLRRWLNETPVFIALSQRNDQQNRYPLFTVLRRHRHTLLPAALLTCALTTAVVTLVVVTPALLQQHFGMSADHAFELSSVGIVFLNIGCVIAGRACDRIGPMRSLTLYSLLLPLGVGALYADLILGLGWTAVAYAVAGLCCGIVGVVPSIMVAMFPADVRVSGISFTYNISYSIWASATPLLLIAATPWSPWVSAAFCVVMAGFGLAAGSHLRGPRALTLDEELCAKT